MKNMKKHKTTVKTDENQKMYFLKYMGFMHTDLLHFGSNRPETLAIVQLVSLYLFQTNNQSSKLWTNDCCPFQTKEGRRKWSIIRAFGILYTRLSMFQTQTRRFWAILTCYEGSTRVVRLILEYFNTNKAVRCVKKTVRILNLSKRSKLLVKYFVIRIET